MSEALLVARVAGERFAVPAARIQSVIELDQIIPVPAAPNHVAGLTTLRSRSLTVIDSTIAIGMATEPRERRLALVTEFESCGYALAIDAVESVVEADSAIEPLTVKLAPGWMRCAKGTVATGIGAVLMIDLEQLIAGPQHEEVAQQ
jgi:chemotaxis signal transduction protein